MKKSKTFLELSRKSRSILSDLMDGNETNKEKTLLVALARTLEIAADADDQMKQQGMVQVFENGSRQVSPEWAIFRNAIRDAQSLVKDVNKIAEAKGGSKKIEQKASIMHLNKRTG